MLEVMDVMTAINKLLVAEYPDDVVYLDTCPQGFERPGFLIEKDTEFIQRRSYRAVEVTEYYTITCYDQVDERHSSPAERVLARQRAVLNLFRKGYLRVENRALKVFAGSGGRDGNEAYVDVQLTYFDETAPPEADRTLPEGGAATMEHIDIDLKKE